MSSALVACGGGDVVPAVFDRQGRPAATASAVAPAATPRTRSALYASAAQYRQEALDSSAYTVLVDVDAAGGEAQAIDGAMAAHAWEPANPAEQQAYFVASMDRSTGVRVADVLTVRGLPNVFLLLDGVAAGATTDAPPVR